VCSDLQHEVTAQDLLAPSLGIHLVLMELLKGFDIMTGHLNTSWPIAELIPYRAEGDKLQAQYPPYTRLYSDRGKYEARRNTSQTIKN
jgi:hypothetical protein